MSFKKFILRARGQKKYFFVHVYDNIGDLRKDADEFDFKGSGKVNGSNDKYYGICNTFKRYKVLPTGKWQINDNIGIIRLAKGYLSVEITSHEVAHAAFWQYRINHKRHASFEDKENKNEEEFASIYGKLFHDITNKLYKHGFWK